MSFTCPVCRSVSFHPNDRLEGYCGQCHAFTGGSTVMSCWTVYDHPSDYPNHYVAREWLVLSGGALLPAESVIIAEDLGLLRERLLVDMGKVAMARNDEDDPTIVETWI